MIRTRILSRLAWLALLPCCSEPADPGLAAVPGAGPARAAERVEGPAPVAPVGRIDAATDREPGTIVGRVLHRGPAPEPRALELPRRGGVCPVPVTTELRFARELRVDRTGGVADVLVSFDVPARDPPEPERVSFEWRGHRLEPHVLLVPAGSAVGFRNRDTCLHRARLAAAGFELTVPAGREEWHVFSKAQKIGVEDPLHPWVANRLIVTGRPFAALTGPDGSFELTGVPPGKHELELEHETLGSFFHTVEVAPGGVETVELRFQ